MRNDNAKKVLDWLDQALEQGRKEICKFPPHGRSRKRPDCWGCLVLTNGDETTEVWADDSEREEVLRTAATNGLVPVGVLVHYRQERGKGATMSTARIPVGFDSRRVETAARNYLTALSYRYKLHGRLDADLNEVLDDGMDEARREFWKTFTAASRDQDDIMD